MKWSRCWLREWSYTSSTTTYAFIESSDDGIESLMLDLYNLMSDFYDTNIKKEGHNLDTHTRRKKDELEKDGKKGQISRRRGEKRREKLDRPLRQLFQRVIRYYLPKLKVCMFWGVQRFPPIHWVHRHPPMPSGLWVSQPQSWTWKKWNKLRTYTYPLKIRDLLVPIAP